MKPSTAPESARSAILARAWARVATPRFLWRAFLVLVGVFVLYRMYGQAWRAHIHLAMNPSYCNDDARVQIYPLLRYEEPGLFPNDYQGDYVLATLGSGYRLLYLVAAKLWDVRLLSKALPYVLFGITTLSLAVAAARWSRLAGAWVVAALCLSTDVFIERMGGGLPRGFGFAIAACAVAALAHGRMVLLAVVTCVGASFYAAAAVPVGMTLAIVVLLFPAQHRGSVAAWSLKRRLLLVGGTAVVSLLILMPTALALRPYGSYVRPTDVKEFPEAGPDGRFYPGDRPPYNEFPTVLTDEAPKSLLGAGEPRTKWLEDEAASRTRLQGTRSALANMLLGLGAAGFLALAARRSSAKRVLAFAGAAVVGFYISFRFVPLLYLPQRYLSYPAPILAALFIVGGGVGIVTLFPKVRRRPWLRDLLVLALGIGCLGLLGGKGSPNAGLNTSVAGSKLVPFAAKLPKDVMIAGWPGGSIEGIPYFSKRQAFITFEAHLPFHVNHTREMRRRAEALIKAYLGTDLAPILALRDEFGVTHMLVDTRHFSGKAPRYFKPFDALAAREFAEGSGKGFELERQIKTASIFQEGTHHLIDLSRLAPVAPGR